jgi:probable HAF family extracellular repeat protein
MPFRKAVLSLAVLLFSTLALAQGTYTQIDYPGANLTQVMGIDAAGDMVGNYSLGESSQGFLFSGGVFTSITYPGSAFTVVGGINDMGQIVGSGIRRNEPSVGFIYDLPTQIFTEVSTHDPNLVIAPLAINNAGTIAGVVDPTASSPYRGFVDSSGTIQFFQVPGAAATWANGISAAGEIVGYCLKMRGDTKLQNFSFKADKFKFLFIPNTPATLVSGISPSGSAIVGYYVEKPSDQYYGFVYQNHAVTTLQFPGAFSTWAIGINDNGEVVGYFQDVNLNYHGYTWTPPAAAGKK